MSEAKPASLLGSQTALQHSVRHHLRTAMTNQASPTRCGMASLQVQTRTKLFSGSSAAFGVEPNTNVAPFDVAMPGTLPSLNRAVVDAAVRLGFALGALSPRQRRRRRLTAAVELEHHATRGATIEAGYAVAESERAGEGLVEQRFLPKCSLTLPLLRVRHLQAPRSTADRHSTASTTSTMTCRTGSR